MTTQIIGIDCATRSENVGLARGTWSPNGLTINTAHVGGKDQGILRKTLRDWITSSPLPTLMALDAPLGWPTPMRELLPTHRAGERLGGDNATFFNRHTDRHIASVYKKRPLDVGADRIARTAFWALDLLARLSQELQREAPIPLAWSSMLADSLSAIEVYPAVSLKTRRVNSEGYKDVDDAAVRQVMLADLLATSGSTSLEDGVGTAMIADSDVFDAVVCAVAGADMLSNLSEPPDRFGLLESAVLEGWIWAPITADSQAASARVDAARL